MQVSGKLLLNSAENILKERHKEQRPAGSGATGEAAARTTTEGLNQSTLESRLLKLQANLSTIQHQYSREQARSTYLSENPDQIGPDLKFGDEALFPEFQAGMNLEGLQKDVSGAMERLIRSLKSVQVEMENLYALNFDAPPEARPDSAARLIEQGGLRNLDPARVAHLTRNSD